MHVADGIDVDQKSHAGDDQNHQSGQVIEQISKVGLEVSCLDPGEVIRDDRQLSSGRLSICRNAPSEITNESATLPAAIAAIRLFGEALAEDAVDGGADRGKRGMSQSKLKKSMIRLRSSELRNCGIRTVDSRSSNSAIPHFEFSPSPFQ